MKTPDGFETGSVEDILLSFQAVACDLWRVNHAEGADPTERELHELTEVLLARHIFELQNSAGKLGSPISHPRASPEMHRWSKQGHTRIVDARAHKQVG